MALIHHEAAAVKHLPVQAHLIVYDNIISFTFHYRLFSLQRFVAINHWWGYICHCTNSMNRYYYYFRLMFDKNKNKTRVEIFFASFFFSLLYSYCYICSILSMFTLLICYNLLVKLNKKILQVELSIGVKSNLWRE